MSSLCEFVETSTSDMGSGWRSLFGTLKAVRMPMYDLELSADVVANSEEQEEGQNGEEGAAGAVHWRAVLDVFEAFLATENPQVNAK